MKKRQGWRAHVGWYLRIWADRVDRPNAPKIMSYSFTFETGEGIRFRDDGRGCRLAYLGDIEYDKAHSESDSEQREQQQRADVDRFLAEHGLPNLLAAHTAVETTHTAVETTHTERPDE